LGCFKLRELLLECLQLASRPGGEGDAAAERVAQRPAYRKVGGRAVAGVPRALQLVLDDVAHLGAGEMRQLQVIEEELHELFAGQAEREAVLALALAAPVPAAVAVPALWPLDPVPG